MLPNVSGAIFRWGRALTMNTITTTTVDFVPTNVITPREITAVVQPADKKKLNPDIVDWSLEYMMIHSIETVDLGERFVHLGVEYKVVESKNYIEYGYSETVGEQSREPLLS